MPRLRALLLWIVAFALPFQGYAAATMAFCAPPQLATVTATADAELTALARSDLHDHAKHQHGGVEKKSGNESGAQAASAAPDAPDAVHKCGTCGACHVTALPSAALPCVFNPLPQVRLAEPFDAVATLAPRVLDKPPRA